MCNTQVMPLNSSGAVIVTQEQLQTVRSWIMNGAPGPS
jgi:hypothetical protein